jgi:hypothetical protein
MSARLLLPLFLAGVLTACAADPALQRQAVLDEVMANYRANLAGVQMPGEAPAPDSPAPEPVAALAGMPVRTAQLLGQSPDALRQVLGEPRLRRKEGDAEIWLYQSPFCHLDLMLYGDTASPRLRVAYATARASGTESRTEAACLRELVTARQG